MRVKKMIGEKCYLSPLDVEDINQYVKWLNSEDVFRYLLVGTSVISYETEKEALLRLSEEHVCGIIDKENDVLIGNKEYWGKGYGTEALRLLVDYAFRVLGIENILIRTFEYSERARKSYEKVGFQYIGVRRKSHYYDNARHNEIYMDILKENFYK